MKNGGRVIALEPYCGGSHALFIAGLTRRLPLAVDLLSLPARAWKWRMRLAASFFAETLRDVAPADAVLCSGFVDVACLLGMGPAWLRQKPVTLYFHENQFAYPVREKDERDLHFAITNLTSALASDLVAFNSAYNRDTFFAGAEDMLRRAPDMRFDRQLASLREKVMVLPPGLDFSDIDAAEPMPVNASGEPPIVLWNHRWEHDKGPEIFFDVLFRLAEEGEKFRLVVLGQSFRERDPIFDQARERLAERILHFGWADREEYCRWLKAADVVVSTARHEFFGMSVIEAARAGCRPLLPARLSYPELFGPDFLYREDKFAEALRLALTAGRIGEQAGRGITERFSWETLAPCYLVFLAGRRL